MGGRVANGHQGRYSKHDVEDVDACPEEKYVVTVVFMGVCIGCMCILLRKSYLWILFSKGWSQENTQLQGLLFRGHKTPLIMYEVVVNRLQLAFCQQLEIQL